MAYWLLLIEFYKQILDIIMKMCYLKDTQKYLDRFNVSPIYVELFIIISHLCIKNLPSMCSSAFWLAVLRSGHIPYLLTEPSQHQSIIDEQDSIHHIIVTKKHDGRILWISLNLIYKAKLTHPTHTRICVPRSWTKF